MADYARGDAQRLQEVLNRQGRLAFLSAPGAGVGFVNQLAALENQNLTGLIAQAVDVDLDGHVLRQYRTSDT
jgi:hypothetical protein